MSDQEKQVQQSVKSSAGNIEGDFNIKIRGRISHHGNYGEIHGSGYTEGNTNVYINQPLDLPQAAKEIQDLLDRLQTYPTTTTIEQMMVATEAVKQIESNPTLKQKVINAAKAGLIEGLKKSPIGAIVAAIIEGWTAEHNTISRDR